MNQSTRQAFFSAANADFKKNNGKGRSFRLDGRLEQGEQLGNIYYKDLDGVTNPYDRGHLTRRDAISWGDTKKLANKASRDSCFFPNVTLQHANFNQARNDRIRNGSEARCQVAGSPIEGRSLGVSRPIVDDPNKTRSFQFNV